MVVEPKNEVQKIKNIQELPFRVKFGVEMDYLEGREEEIKIVLEKLKFDYVIGSVHFIHGWNFDTDSAGYTNENIDSLYIEYFRLLQQAALSELFDIIGHADVIKKFNYYPSFKLANLYRKTAKTFKRADVVVEINTSGLSKPCNEFYPAEEFLKICKKEKVPITMGSDAHKADNIAQHFTKALSLIKAIGYKEIAVFENRKRSFIPI